MFYIGAYLGAINDGIAGHVMHNPRNSLDYLVQASRYDCQPATNVDAQTTPRRIDTDTAYGQTQQAHGGADPGMLVIWP